MHQSKKTLPPPSATSRQPRCRGLEYVRTVLAQTETRLALLLGCLASLLLTTYLFYGFIIPQTPGRMTKPSAALIQELPLWAFIVSLPLPIPHNSHLLAVLLIGLTTVAFAAYGFAVYISWKRQSHATSLGVVIYAALLFFLVTAWSLPNVNTDIYNYIMRGRVAAVYNSNPYYVAADEFPDDPIYPYASHRFTGNAGGKFPTWMLFNIALSKLAGDNVITNLLVYRGAFLLFNLANLVIIAIILHRSNPRHLLAGVILYAWNPIVVIYGQSKTDTVMVFFFLLATLFLVTGRRQYAVVALGLSVFVKLITLPLVVVYWLREFSLRRWRQLAVSTLLLGLTVVAIYAPFWEGPSLLLQHLGHTQAGGSTAPNMIRTLLQAGFLLLMLWIGLRQTAQHEKLLHGWAVVMLYFSLFLTNYSLAWYQMTLLAIVSLTDDWRLVMTTIILSFSSFLLNSWHATSTSAFPLPDLFTLPRLFVYLMPLCTVAMCLAALVVWQKIRQRRHLQV